MPTQQQISSAEAAVSAVMSKLQADARLVDRLHKIAALGFVLLFLWPTTTFRLSASAPQLACAAWLEVLFIVCEIFILHRLYVVGKCERSVRIVAYWAARRNSLLERVHLLALASIAAGPRYKDHADALGSVFQSWPVSRLADLELDSGPEVLNAES